MEEAKKQIAVFCMCETRKYAGKTVFTKRGKKQVKNIAKAVIEWANGDEIVVQFATWTEETATAVASAINSKVISHNKRLNYYPLRFFTDEYWLNLPSAGTRIVFVVNSRELHLTAQKFIYRRDEFECIDDITNPGCGVFLKLDPVKNCDDMYFPNPVRTFVQDNA
ncbi:MAG: hypothetical protein LBL08_01310 [Candidatus Nomurabacteria bacterium]|jgi:hypothetical protein|nr:hypothetical protein [Candidatus Nomurabacteria bacterium]